ncbi:MAG: hypothetical protein QGI86_10295 [Candidatus Poribacteria bacterium]|nr:hypothetical protein [Candidatus Poribacteria bacterium]MDP6746261.1 hypothetical protein [Candidatus Poribacteria bacterium]MDP6996692.1 hypothetical protein [Candidatus Poribacteria bacterium]
MTFVTPFEFDGYHLQSGTQTQILTYATGLIARRTNCLLGPIAAGSAGVGSV